MAIAAGHPGPGPPLSRASPCDGSPGPRRSCGVLTFAAAPPSWKRPVERRWGAGGKRGPPPLTLQGRRGVAGEGAQMAVVLQEDVAQAAVPVSRGRFREGSTWEPRAAAGGGKPEAVPEGESALRRGVVVKEPSAARSAGLSSPQSRSRTASPARMGKRRCVVYCRQFRRTCLKSSNPS